MRQENHIRRLDQLGLGDVSLVGGKTASLGELFTALAPNGINVPDGFALTSAAYRKALEMVGCNDELADLMRGLGQASVKEIAVRAKAARRLVYQATGIEDILRALVSAYRKMEERHGRGLAVAVRSSATAEDLSNASFGGQHDSFVNFRGEEAVFEACRKCFASLFTDRAIVYRNQNGSDHMKVALSVAVMKMVRSDRAASGVIFTLDTESGFRDIVLVTGSYGLGENIVQGRVDPDEFCVHEPTFATCHRAVLRHRLGAKQIKMVFGDVGGGRTTRNLRVGDARARYCISDKEVLALADAALLIEAHYSGKAGHPTPMDIEWARDGPDGKLFIVEARPETVASQRTTGTIQSYTLDKKGRVLASGRAIGEKIASGRVRLVRNARDLAAFKTGEILVADKTPPDWESVMKRAAGIVTNRGGRTCHAAIIAREMRISAVVGTGDATHTVKRGETVTICCAEGEAGHVYQGALDFRVAETRLADLPRPNTKIMANLGDPDLAFQTAMLPNDGVNLARMEFIINQFIGIHPMALATPVENAGLRRRILKMTGGRPKEYFVDRLAEGVSTIAAAFYPRPVIVPLSDFKTNEYAQLLGGNAFEPKEANPMLGFRGASRYAHLAYAAGFALECKALRKVRETFGLTNLKVMVPFCRREEEARRVISAMANNGLVRGENDLEIFM